MRIPDNQGVAVVTEACSGVGARYAKRLAERGYNLILSGANGDRLERVAAAATQVARRKVELIVADLADPDQLAAMTMRFRSDCSIRLLVNNPDVSIASTLLHSEPHELARMTALNTLAPMRVTSAIIPGFVSAGTGTIINVASTQAFPPASPEGVNGAMAAFLFAFSRSLRREFGNSGVRVQTVLACLAEPDTSAVPEAATGVGMCAEDIVDAAMAGLDLREAVSIPSLHDLADWEAFEVARETLCRNLRQSNPASRYGPEFTVKVVRPW